MVEPLKKKKYIGYLLIILVFIIVDQITKIAVSHLESDIILCNGMLIFRKVVNTGMAFSMNQNNNQINIMLTIIVFLIVVNFIKNQLQNIDPKTEIALSLVIAGGIGNLIDRIFRGGVIDFISIGKFPIFNIADMIIVVGWIILIISTIKKMTESPQERIKNM